MGPCGFHIFLYRSGGFALTGYDIPGCVEDGAWMLGKWAVIGFHYDFGASEVRGSIRLVFRVPLERESRQVVVKKKSNNILKTKQSETGKTGIA